MLQGCIVNENDGTVLVNVKVTDILESMAFSLSIPTTLLGRANEVRFVVFAKNGFTINTFVYML